MGKKGIHKTDNDEVQKSHIRIRTEILDSPAFQGMSLSSRAAYPLIRRMLDSWNNGNISLALSDAKKRGWASSSKTNTRIRLELETIGLISVTRQGGVGSLSRRPTLYRFTDLDSWGFKGKGVSSFKRSDDYKKFENKRQAKSAIKSAIEARKRRQEKLNHKLPK